MSDELSHLDAEGRARMVDVAEKPVTRRECVARGILTLRIVHGKGIGVKREIVRSVLENHPQVVSFRHEGGSGGGWGATVVNLRP